MQKGMMMARSHMLVLAAVVLVAGCNQAPEQKGPEQKGNVAAANQVQAAGGPAQPANAAAPIAAKPQKIESKLDGFEFSYAWPEQAAAIPELNAWLRANADKLRWDNQKLAQEDKASAKKDGYPYNDHMYSEEWDVIADTPRFLVMQSDGYVYTGGAHGMPVQTGLIWDKQAKKRLPMNALVDIAALSRLAKPQFCAELDRQRVEKRGEPVPQGSGIGGIDEFYSCIDMGKQLLLPWSDKGRSLDSIRVVIGPYEAGPYAEGSYVIDLKMTNALMAAVKPAYRSDFTGTP